MFGRFAALVAARAAHTATRTFFTPRADAWEARFAADGPRYAAAVARMGLLPGQTALDLGCGSGRALPALRAGVGDKGKVFGVDVTSAMLTAAAREGRAGPACLLVADCHRLPLPPGATHGIFSAGLLDHLPAPPVALREWAHPVGEFPHEKIDGADIESYIAPGNATRLRRPDRAGRDCHWILEIHLIDRERGFGGFHEELLDLG